MRKTIRIGVHIIYLKDIVIAAIITILPFLFFVYKLAPETQSWDLGIFKISTSGFVDVSVFLWLLNSKVVLFLALVLWFITCKNWWRFVIIVPITIELLKITTMLTSELIAVDKFELIYALPLILIVISLIFLLARKLNYFSMAINMNHQLNYEIENLFNSLYSQNDENIVVLRLQFTLLKTNRENLDNEEYLNQLIDLRDKIKKIK